MVDQVSRSIAWHFPASKFLQIALRATVPPTFRAPRRTGHLFKSPEIQCGNLPSSNVLETSPNRETSLGHLTRLESVGPV